MKNYIIKSSIVFFIVLILGIILIPMIPTEKEIIYSNGYELLVDSDEMIYIDNYFTYDFELTEYNIFLIAFYSSAFDGAFFVYLSYNSNTIINISGTDFIISYNNDKISAYINLLAFGYLDISVWGVSK